MKMIKGGDHRVAVNHGQFAPLDGSGHQSQPAASHILASQNMVAINLRMALLLVPLFLSMAVYCVFPALSFDKIIFIGFCFAGIALVLLAALASNIPRGLTAIVTLIFYSAVLGFASFYANASNALVWAMVLALPLEIRLVTGHRMARIAGIVLAITLLIAALINASMTETLHPAMSAIGLQAGLSTLFLMVYAGALVLRIMHAPVRSTGQEHSDFIAMANDEDLEVALDALVIRLDTDGHISSLSERSARQFGVERAVLNGTLLLDRVHVADRVKYLAFLNRLKTGVSALGLNGKTEIRLRCVDKHAEPSCERANIFFADFRLEGQPRNAGNVESFLLIARNMAAAEETQTRFHQQSATIENLELSRVRLLDTVSHELRTPLNSIIGFSDLLLHDIAGPLQSDKQREYIDLIRKSGNHLLGVVNSILEASRLESGHYPLVHDHFSLRDSVSFCNAMLMPVADKKGVVLCDRLHPSVEEMIGDGRAVQQILINLVSNAIKFTDRGGCVTIDVMPEANKYGYAGEAPRLVITVSDTGIGLEPHEIERLCQPFTQINNTQTRMQEGSGLGLYLVKGLVDLHNGEMTIRSKKGQGTCVSITLPQTQLHQKQTVDNTPIAADRPLSGAIRATEQSAADISNALEQVKTALINIQAQQAESTYDGKTESQRYETQGSFDAQKRKTA